MKALLTAIASALLLLICAPSFAQTSNGMGGAATTNPPAATSADQQNWQGQPAMTYQNSRANADIDYGMPANGSYQSGRPINQGGFTEPTFGHH